MIHPFRAAAVRRTAPLLLAALLAFACADDPGDGGAPGESDDELAVFPEDKELGKSLFDSTGDTESKEDGLTNSKGLVAAEVDDSATQVWPVWRDWADTDPEPGLAWEADSGLSWYQKYALWIRSMKKIDSESYFQTYEFTTPWGKTLPSPALECAETSMFLRAAFASWYGLPFIMEARDRNGSRLYLGHFGFRTAAGKYGRTPSFKGSYKDYSDLADEIRGDLSKWPSDPRLVKRKLGGSQDDQQPFLGDNAHAGAYFDQVFLNKRVGYFMVFLLSYFGSVNLADSANTFNLTPEAVREGDSLLERWQRRGIGHTLVVKRADQFGEAAFEVELISGSMPRRQGAWESAASSKSYFTTDYTGGPGEGSDGAYSKLGGGLKRWRTPVKINGRWTMIVPAADQDSWINDRNFAAIGERINTFERILREVPPEEKREVLLQQISDARNHLRSYPASCSKRERREEAFDKLYELSAEHFGQSQAEVDAEYRILEDYVFAEMVYEKSKTCCWNSSTAAMHEIVMLKAAKDTEDHTALECRLPDVFKERDGGYELFKTFAASIGRGDEWVAWSEDEPCAQRDSIEGVEADHRWTNWCDVGHEVLAR